MMPAMKNALRTLLLAAVSTGLMASPALASSALSKRWVGEEAGKFFAAYGPPNADMSSFSKTVYNWRGGFQKRKVPAVKDKNGKIVTRARTVQLACQVKLTVDKSYHIKKIEVVADRDLGAGKPTWCEEYLDAAKAK